MRGAERDLIMGEEGYQDSQGGVCEYGGDSGAEVVFREAEAGAVDVEPVEGGAAGGGDLLVGFGCFGVCVGEAGVLDADALGERLEWGSDEARSLEDGDVAVWFGIH